MTALVPLPRLRGQVHRFCVVVDRFGSFPRGDETEHTICIRNLRLADRDLPVDVDHWWFRLREVWNQAGVRVGDTVLFTAKVQRCTKGWADPGTGGDRLGIRRPLRRRSQTVGFGASPRSVVVLRRLNNNRLLEELSAEGARREASLGEALAEIQRLEQHRQTLLQDAQQVRQQLDAERRNRRQREQQLEHRHQELCTRLARARRRSAIAALVAASLGGLGGVLLSRALAPAGQPLPPPERMVLTSPPS